jgi:hypothetical protein
MVNDKAELEAKVAALTEKLAELEQRVPKPAEPAKAFVPGPRGPSTSELAMANVSMPASAMDDLVRAVPDGLMRDVAGDAHRNSALRSLGAEPAPKPRGSGCLEPAPLSNPPGVGLADRLMDAQAAKDRAELIEKEARRLTMTPKVETDAA